MTKQANRVQQSGEQYCISSGSFFVVLSTFNM